MKRNKDFLPTIDPKSLPPAITTLTQQQKDAMYQQAKQRRLAQPREPGSDDEPIPNSDKP